MILRTPEERFANLSDYSFAPHYATIADATLGPIRLHYLDEGPRDGAVVLLLHGEPTWSYLYRKMIPPLVAAGYRVVAPDLVGFGKSDKPAERADYSYAGHVRWMSDWLRACGLSGITLFCQDWGGLIGLRLVAAFPDRFSRVCVSNSMLPTGRGRVAPAFEQWRDMSQSVADFDSGGIVAWGTVRDVPDNVRDGYNAPYPHERYKAGARAFPLLVPTTPDAPEAAENRAAWKVLARLDKPVLTLFGDRDPIMAGGDLILQERIPGAAGQPHRTIANTGHFSQEDAGEELAAHLIDWMRDLSANTG